MYSSRHKDYYTGQYTLHDHCLFIGGASQLQEAWENVVNCLVLRGSGDVCIDSTDIGMIHFLVWLELGRTAKNSRKQKRTIRRWRLDKFGYGVVREKY